MATHKLPSKNKGSAVHDMILKKIINFNLIKAIIIHNIYQG